MTVQNRLYTCLVQINRTDLLPNSYSNVKNLVSGSNSQSGLTVGSNIVITYITNTDVSLPSNVSGLELLDYTTYHGNAASHLSNIFCIYKVKNSNVSFTIPTLSPSYGNADAMFYN